MRIYLASVFNTGITKDSHYLDGLNDTQRKARTDSEFILESYHYCWKQKMTDQIRHDGDKVFLDSGAFSAFFGGVKIDINAFCDYIHRNGDIIECASVLDGIGDPLKTWENQQEMERQGTRPLPCFHYGEDPEFLKWYVANYDYITLGGMVPISTPQLKLWLDEIWGKYLTDDEGKPLIKVHGFGMTSLMLMKRYPWFSVDSSTWVQMARFGNIFLPSSEKALCVSDESPDKKNRGKHFDTLTQPEKDAIAEEVEGFGYNMTLLKSDTYARRVFNMLSFRVVQDNINKANPNPTFKPAFNGLF